MKEFFRGIFCITKLALVFPLAVIALPIDMVRMIGANPDTDLDTYLDTLMKWAFK